MRLILVVATGRTRRRMGAAVPVLVALATTLSGCGVSPENTSAVAVYCAQQVRFHGVVYTGYS